MCPSNHTSSKTDDWSTQKSSHHNSHKAQTNDKLIFPHRPDQMINDEPFIFHHYTGKRTSNPKQPKDGCMDNHHHHIYFTIKQRTKTWCSGHDKGNHQEESQTFKQRNRQNLHELSLLSFSPS